MYMTYLKNIRFTSRILVRTCLNFLKTLKVLKNIKLKKLGTFEFLLTFSYT